MISEIFQNFFSGRAEGAGAREAGVGRQGINDSVFIMHASTPDQP